MAFNTPIESAKKSPQAVEAPMKPFSPPPEPPTPIRMSKGEATNFSIGDKVTVTISGEVVNIRECYRSSENEIPKYDVDLKDSHIVRLEGNMADKEMKTMMHQEPS